MVMRLWEECRTFVEFLRERHSNRSTSYTLKTGFIEGATYLLMTFNFSLSQNRFHEIVIPRFTTYIRELLFGESGDSGSIHVCALSHTDRWHSVDLR